MSKLSPQQFFNNLLKIWAILCVLTLGSCTVGFYADKPYTEATSHNATLELAYTYSSNCNKYGDHCTEKYKGRFKAEDGQRYDRDIDGFFYHSFVDKGRKEMPAYITLSKNDMGIESPMWIRVSLGLGFLFAFIFVGGGFALLLATIEVEYEQDKWEREQARKERDAQWRNF